MATYLLKTTRADVTLNTNPQAIGITSTVVQLKTNGTVSNLGNSDGDATGTITSLPVGQSPELANSVLVVTTVVNLVNVPQAQWNSVFENLQIVYELAGGVTGQPAYNVLNGDKMLISDNKIIVVTKSITFSAQ